MNNNINSMHTNNKLDLVPFLCEAFSTNTKTYKYIDQIYNTDKLRFINKAKENKWYDSSISKEGNIEQEYYFKKILGILLVTQEDIKITDAVLKLISKVWKYTWTYVKQHSILNLYDFINSYIKKKHGIDNVTDDELNSNGLMLMFLGIIYDGKTINEDDNMYKGIIASYFQRMIHMNGKCRISLNNASKEQKKLIRDLELKLKKS